MSGPTKSIATTEQMRNRLRARTGLHPKARFNAAGETESSEELSDHASNLSDAAAEPATRQDCNENGLEFIDWPSKRKVSPTISLLTAKQMDMLLDLDQQGVRYQIIKSNVADGLKGNLAAATSKYMVKAYKFLTAIKPDITIKQAAAHPVLRNRKLL